MYRETYPQMLPDMLAGKRDVEPWDDDASSVLTTCAVALAHESDGIVEFQYIDNVDLVRQSLSILMSDKDLPFDVQQQMWEEIDAA